MPDSQTIAKAYDGSTAAYRALSAWGWGPLANLGYYPLLQIPLTLGGLGRFQRRLARESIRLLQVGPRDRVLDSGCGQGWTTREIAASGATVLGVDLIDAQIASAKERYSGEPRVHFGQADATRLPAELDGFELSDASLNAVHCLEFAFHLGAKERRLLIEQSFRLLAPGGRLVLVDFMWGSRRPDEIEEADPERLVRDTWRFDTFEPLERYRDTAREVGFEELAIHNWSRMVTARFQAICDLNVAMMRFAPTRWLFWLIRRQTMHVPTTDWQHLGRVMQAHSRVRKRSQYTAIVWQKPR